MHYQPPSNTNQPQSPASEPGGDFVSRLVENGWPEFAKDQGFGEASKNPAAGISYDLFLQCIHCGMCTSSCPTFNLLGDENDGPRGRIQIMRTVADGKHELTDRMRRHLDLCLDCRACETACPSGVEYSKLIEPFRMTLKQTDRRIENRFDWFREIILFQLFPYAERMRLLLSPVRMMQWLGIYQAIERLGLFKLVPGRLGRMVPLLPSPLRASPRLPKFSPAIGRKRARVAFFTGCVADAMFRPTHWATVRVLQQNGCDVFVPPDQACCGAIHFHAGDSRGRGSWPIRTSSRSSWTATTRSSSTTAAAGRCSRNTAIIGTTACSRTAKNSPRRFATFTNFSTKSASFRRAGRSRPW